VRHALVRVDAGAQLLATEMRLHHVAQQRDT
jgi:hypothetical protein